MCELLGMSANVPTDICFSFTGLARRGGDTGPHTDGWGITFYEGKGYRDFKDPSPSATSEIARLVERYPIKSQSVISHIRQANRGRVALENTHPFTRVLWRRYWTYAHNGQLSGYKDKLTTQRFRPVGNTDSELAFCWLLEQLETRWPDGPSSRMAAFRLLAEKCDELRELGVFNMLLTDGTYVMAYCGKQLSWITRRAPFGEASLIDADMIVDFEQETTPNDVVSVIATRPLTDNETWHVMTPGQWQLFKNGEPVLSD